MALPAPAVGAQITAAWGQAVIIPVTDTSIGSVASGFTLVDGELMTMLDGRLIMFRVQVSSTSGVATNPGAGNNVDMTVFTLDAAYRPRFEVGVPVYGGMLGTGYVQPDGDVRLANISDAVAAGGNLVFSGTFLTD